jgi:hypothetical protein
MPGLGHDAHQLVQAQFVLLKAAPLAGCHGRGRERRRSDHKQPHQPARLSPRPPRVGDAFPATQCVVVGRYGGARLRRAQRPRITDNARVTVPAHPRIYHITHVDNLPRIVADGGLLSDALVVAQGGPEITIGMSDIKRRRLEEIQVTCHPGTFVGEYVPFYFCPRSIMLYMFWKDNRPEITYHGGQESIVHIVADLHSTTAAADEGDRRWAFSLSNAGARYAEFRNDLDDLQDVDWGAVASHDFWKPEVKEGKQAEYLLHEMFSLDLVGGIGVHSEAVRDQALEALEELDDPPPVAVRRAWYY